jgi:hypothetical protein
MATITKHYERNEHGVTWANIEITEIEGGLRFTSPVDGDTYDVDGLTLKEFESNAWFQGKYWYDILEAISNSGGGEWYVVDGGNTEYEYFQSEGKHYLFVEERE